MEAFFILAAKLLLYPHYTAQQIDDWFKGKIELPVTGTIRDYILNDQSYLVKDNSNIIGYNPEFQYIEQFYKALESSDGTFHILLRHACLS